MKRKLFLSILIVFFTTSFMSLVGCNNQNPTKEQSSVSEKELKDEYNSRDKCGKRCEEYFRKEYGNGSNNTYSGQMMSGYQNHYNKKLNKCFIIITNTSIPNDKETDVLLMKSIYDFNENKSYGDFDKYNKKNNPEHCNVLDKKCESESEWDSLVKPYMEE
jgi:hypothetical protein